MFAWVKYCKSESRCVGLVLRFFDFCPKDTTSHKRLSYKQPVSVQDSGPVAAVANARVVSHMSLGDMDFSHAI